MINKYVKIEGHLFLLFIKKIYEQNRLLLLPYTDDINYMILIEIISDKSWSFHLETVIN